MTDASRLDEEHDEQDRTVGPFTAVIAQYKKHGDRAVRRNRTEASLHYFARMLQLEGMNGTDYSQ